MKSQAVQLLESTNYLQAVINDVNQQQDPTIQVEIIAEWLNDVDSNYQLGSSHSALMRHAKTVQNYIKKNC
jgi:hypothetical protein